MSFLCLFGKGTKISKYLVEHDKVYEAVIKLGEKTVTGDREGEIICVQEVHECNLEEEKVKNTLKKFVGKQKQKPPIYSAIKVSRKEAL